jgi:RNA polymerase sigma-70 factor (ECF subfamily)
MSSWDLAAVLGALVEDDRPRPAGPDDGVLVTRIQGGDRAAFEQLYRRHADLVYARLSRIVGPIAERDDLLQEVFLGLYRALPRFRGEAALSTLLYRITANVAFDHLRRRGRRPVERADVEALAAVVSGEAGPDERARRAEELARVLAALDRVKPKKRIALLLRIVEGLSFEEIGAIVETSADTAKKRAQHGLRELTALLRRAPEEAP